MEYVEVEGVRSRVIERGPSAASEAIVYVHGSPGDAADWQGLLDLTGAFARSVAIGMPGYGESDKPADFSYTNVGYGRHIAGALLQLGITRAHLVGHDLGVAWGLAWAASQPGSLASLTLMDLGALPGYRWHRYARLYRQPILGELLLISANYWALNAALGRGTKHGMPREYVNRVLADYNQRGTRRAILRYYRATDLAEDTVKAAESLTAVKPPTLVVWGGGDPYVPVSFAPIQKRYFEGAVVVVLPESGHWPFLDDPDGVANVVVPFLRRQVSTS